MSFAGGGGGPHRSTSLISPILIHRILLKMLSYESDSRILITCVVFSLSRQTYAENGRNRPLVYISIYFEQTGTFFRANRTPS